jgi:hypothetical protein
LVTKKAEHSTHRTLRIEDCFLKIWLFDHSNGYDLVSNREWVSDHYIKGLLIVISPKANLYLLFPSFNELEIVRVCQHEMGFLLCVYCFVDAFREGIWGFSSCRLMADNYRQK